MKKTLLSLALVCGALNAYEINFSKPFSKSVNPDTLTTHMSVSIQKKDEKAISKHLEKFNTFFKNAKDVEIKNGSYNISPRYKYLKHGTKFMGYEGQLRYKIKSKNAKNMNDFISNFTKLKESFDTDDIKINISRVNWEISKKIDEKALEDLRLKALIWAKSYAKQLSEELKANCSLTKVSINPSQRYNQRAMPMYAAKSFSADVAPAKTSEDINIYPNFTIECE